MSLEGEGNTGLSRHICETETGHTESENLSMRGHSVFEYREVSAVPVKQAGRPGKVCDHKPEGTKGVGLRSGGKLAGIATEP